MPPNKLEDLKKQLGDWLREQIGRTSYSNKEVAQAGGIHPVQLSRILSGESGTKRETLEAICAFIGADKFEAFKLLDLVPHEMNATPKKSAAAVSGGETRLSSYYRALPLDRQQELVSYAEWMWQRYGGDALRREAEVKGKKRKVG